jgi:phosphoserine phosphatase RsbX
MSPPPVEWDCAARPFPGEQVSGDRALVTVTDGGAVATAVDGLGHGAAAAMAAERAVDAVRAAGGNDVVVLIERCHAALRETRGAAMSVATIDPSDESLTWLGVGNVEGRIVRGPGRRGARPDELMLSPGVVGHELPPLRATTTGLRRGDLVLLATDGIGAGYADDLEPSGSCRAIARQVLERYARAHDDALVLVIRYLGDRA